MSYLEKHKASGMKVGDRVRILRVAYSGEAGWRDVWAPEMIALVNTVGEISEDRGVAGLLVDDFWNFPYFVLEKVEEFR